MKYAYIAYNLPELTRIFMEDRELKCLGESIVRKEVAAKEGVGTEQILFELEVAKLKDHFEARCMALLASALLKEDPVILMEYIELIKISATESMRTDLFVSLFRNLIRHVLLELDDRSKLELIDRIETYAQR